MTLTSELVTRTIHVAHSPDSDDAFMFYALAAGKVETDGLRYVHELQDIETLNQRALRGELEVTAVSIHAYAYLADSYALLPHGASMGDQYGPRLVARAPMSRDSIRGKRIAIPGPLTSAYLALRLYEPDFTPVPTPRSLDPASYLPVARSLCAAVDAAPSPEEALARARLRAGPDAWVLVAGSLYLVGAVKALLEHTPVPR